MSGTNIRGILEAENVPVRKERISVFGDCGMEKTTEVENIVV